MTRGRSATGRSARAAVSLEVAHLHEKTDRILEEMLARFAKLEKALGKPAG